MIPYILHVALLISVCLLFYKVFLQKETFYGLNRVVLVFCLALSFALPLITVPQQWAFRESPKPVEINAQPTAIQPVVDQPIVTQSVSVAPQNAEVKTPGATKPAVIPNVQPIEKSAAAPVVNAKSPIAVQEIPLLQRVLKWMFYLYWIGVAAFGLNLLLQLVVLLFQAYTKPVIKDGKFRIIELTGDKAPCSFGNNIFINPEKYDWETYSQILLHEKVHIQQGHSFDILIAELVLVLQWFNPFAWLYRTELESNLEFLTDNAVLEHKDVEKSSYQMSLLKVSAPHLSLGITTNYNQSLLKRRILMMNSKRSNLHTMWKYFFLVPLLGILVCALNNPAAYSQAVKGKSQKSFHNTNNWSDKTEGSWFATVKTDKIRIEFKSDDDDNNWSSSSDFMLSEFSALPKDKKGEFTLKREAGSVLFTGKFDDDQGYGHYKFTADKDFNAYTKEQGITNVEDRDAFTFFMIDIKKGYVEMLKRNGYGDISKNNLISMAALKIDEPFIKMWKQNGYNDISPNQLVSAKALHIDEAYVTEIHKAGYPDVTFNQLISFKAQHISGEYINGLRKAKLKEGGNTGGNSLPSANELSSYKALNIDSSYVNSIAAAGYKNIPYRELTTMKSMHITPEFIKSYKDLGYTNLTANNLVTLKSLAITPEFIKGYKAMGFADITVNNLATVKSLQITPEFIKTYKDLGYTDLSINNLATLKSLQITPEVIKSYKDLGFTDLSINRLATLKSLNITKEFINTYKEMGYTDLSVNNLATLKSLHISPDYIKSFEAMGYKNININSLAALKSLNITPEYIDGFKKLGFTDIPLNELPALKSTGVTPEYISTMQEKGFKSKDIRKYVELKNAFN